MTNILCFTVPGLLICFLLADTQQNDEIYVAARAPTEVDASASIASDRSISPSSMSRSDDFEVSHQRDLQQRSMMGSGGRGAWWLAKKMMFKSPAGMGVKSAWWLAKKVVGKGSSKGLSKGMKKGAKSTFRLWRRQAASRGGRGSGDEVS